MENFVLLCMPACCMFIYMYIYVLSVHNPGSARKITDLGNGYLGKLAIDTLHH